MSYRIDYISDIQMIRKFQLALLSILTSCILFSMPVFAQKNLTLVSSMSFSPQSVAGCWHYTDTANNTYALLGTSDGISIVDITNHANPSFLFQLPGVNSLWHEVKVQGDFAYAVSEGTDTAGIKNGVQIIDLRYLPDSAPNKFYQGDGAILNMLTRAHSITTAGEYIYINGHDIASLGRGVLICNISDPWNPVYVGAVTQNYCHDSYVRGDTIYTSDIYAGQFSVYDITNRSNPVLLATQQTPLLFNHNTWLNDAGDVLFTTDERNNAPLAAYDISDLSNITLLDTYFTTLYPSSEVHNVRVLNDYLINPSYGSQLTIVDANRPSNLVEVAYYPTASYLVWDADPYLPSGAILATETNPGTMYIFEPTYVRACYLEGTVRDSFTNLPISGAMVRIINSNLIKYSDGFGGYKTGQADSGTYDIEFSALGYFTKTYSGVQLSNGNLTQLDALLVPDHTRVSELSRNFRISPNPTNDKITVQSELSEIHEIKLSDSFGRIVKQSRMYNEKSGSITIRLDDLSSGVYFCTILSRHGSFVSPIVKY
ncbi:MAG: choice-of-anchor B family protein [Bacteroidetes bacterium]|nr:MAG: choice-of-anchor B family protein [Bacteroidota bacterium]REJ99858.1 MAG: choice-of-anchor B family protein [Bacteroidota bacterium]REK34231.1 MAG: choice-of-anchor B family protein [Bacteroidota bacterium]REK50561.1 MAG: choice-of-anchor B family protein [Bacteroidota bacterium]